MSSASLVAPSTVLSIVRSASLSLVCLAPAGCLALDNFSNLAPGGGGASSTSTAHGATGSATGDASSSTGAACDSKCEGPGDCEACPACAAAAFDAVCGRNCGAGDCGAEISCMCDACKASGAAPCQACNHDGQCSPASHENCACSDCCGDPRCAGVAGCP